jgi:hypothetical protein
MPKKENILEQSQPIVDLLAQYAALGRTDARGTKKPGGKPYKEDKPLDREALVHHLNGGPAHGVYPIRPGESVCRLACLDFDNHKGELTWADMADAARRVSDAAKRRGLIPRPFRSGGGRGIHLGFAWADPQDARSVRAVLKRVLVECGFKDGAGGVKVGEVEVFPKQDRVALGAYGNYFFLPGAGMSEPLDPETFEGLGKLTAAGYSLHYSAPVPIVAPEPPRVSSNADVDLAVVASAVAAIPNDGLDYETWFRIVAAIHACDCGDEGREVAETWSERSDKHRRGWFEHTWDHLDEKRGNGAAFGTLAHHARANGWVDPERTAAIDALDALDMADMAEAIEAIDKAKASASRAKLDNLRREHQKRENERIGEGEIKVPAAEVVTLDDALDRFVFLSDGSRVADTMTPHYDLTFSDFAATYAASKKRITRPDGKIENAAIAKLWREDRNRKTAVARTFKAGGGLFLNDPDGRPCLNAWRPFDRSLVVDPEVAGVRLFLDHVEFLFPDPKDCGRFLDWLAHIEQCPGVLPHTAWLHIASNLGMGRNWLAAVLVRVWAGAVAANLDLVQLLGSGFNGQLSRKILATVDEIHEGGRGTQWEHSERLKQIVTAEIRNVNAKYGRESKEFNACRWLMFSNHVSAIPIQTDDRRIEVVRIEAKPKDAAYYSRLYAALDDRRFIAAVASYLGRRDISGFNPGAHAVETEAKRDVALASQTPMGYWCEMLVKHWPWDVIKSNKLYDALEGIEFRGDGALTSAHRRTLEQYGVAPFKRLVRVGSGNPVRVSILRNRERWATAEPGEVRDELRRAVDGLPTADEIVNVRERLLEQAAPDDCDTEDF